MGRSQDGNMSHLLHIQISSATHLLESGHSIRAVQELLGHKDVGATMAHTLY
jgi:site-specific recombinase XerC